MNDQFTIKQHFTVIEYLRMSFWLMFRMKILRRLFIILSVVSLLSGLLEFAAITKSKSSILYAFAKIIMLPGFLLLFLLIFRLIIYKIKPHYAKGNQYIFNHWGMQKTGAGTDFSAQWSKFTDYRESALFVFLYFDESNSFALQKRMFKNEIQLQAFLQLLEEKIIKHR